jgi:hypothetical protein
MIQQHHVYPHPQPQPRTYHPNRYINLTCEHGQTQHPYIHPSHFIPDTHQHIHTWLSHMTHIQHIIYTRCTHTYLDYDMMKQTLIKIQKQQQIQIHQHIIACMNTQLNMNDTSIPTTLTSIHMYGCITTSVSSILD